MCEAPNSNPRSKQKKIFHENGTNLLGPIEQLLGHKKTQLKGENHKLVEISIHIVMGFFFFNSGWEADVRLVEFAIKGIKELRVQEENY
jgi:hypothetical protein